MGAAVGAGCGLAADVGVVDATCVEGAAAAAGGGAGVGAAVAAVGLGAGAGLGGGAAEAGELAGGGGAVAAAGGGEAGALACGGGAGEGGTNAILGPERRTMLGTGPLGVGSGAAAVELVDGAGAGAA